jgi:hypothetical protein
LADSDALGPPAGARRLPVPEWVTVDMLLQLIGGLVLVLVSFLTKWYGAAGRSSSPFSAPEAVALGPWQTLTVIRWLLVLTATAALLGAASSGHRVSRVVRPATLVIAAVCTVALFYRVLINPPQPAGVDDVKAGGYLALLAAGAITLGAFRPRVPPASRRAAPGG